MRVRLICQFIYFCRVNKLKETLKKIKLKKKQKAFLLRFRLLFIIIIIN